MDKQEKHKLLLPIDIELHTKLKIISTINNSTLSGTIIQLIENNIDNIKLINNISIEEVNELVKKSLN